MWKEHFAGASLVWSMWCATSGQPEEEVAHSRTSGPQNCHLDCWTGISPVIMMAGLTHHMCAYALLLVCHKTKRAGRQENHWWRRTFSWLTIISWRLKLTLIMTTKTYLHLQPSLYIKMLWFTAFLGLTLSPLIKTGPHNVTVLTLSRQHQ